MHEPDGGAAEGFDVSGFSVVLLAAVESPRPQTGVIAACADEFDCDVASLETDPLPLGDRDVVLEALGAAGPILESGRAAVYESDGVIKVVTPDSGIVVIERVATGYWDDPADATIGIADAALVRAIASHRSFVEVGILGLDVVDDPVDATQRLCRFAATLCSEDIVAVLVPDRELIGPADEGVLGALCSDEPFDWPIVEQPPSARRLDAHDDQFDRGVSKARGAWPRFVREFRESPGGRTFSVKIGVVERDVCENLWFELQRIDGDWIECSLESEPIYLTGIVRGDRRRIPATEVLDWVFVAADGQRVGGFTF